MTAPTTVRAPLARQAALVAGAPLVGAAVGVALGLLFELVSASGIGPDGLLGYGTHVGEPVGLLVTASAGALVGLLVAVGARQEAPRALITGRHIAFRWDDARVTVPRSQVQHVVLGHDVVVLGENGMELARVHGPLDAGRFRAALAQHRYPAPTTCDPYESDFGQDEALLDRAVPIRPPVDRRVDPADVRCLLDARAVALRTRARGDAEHFRRELASRGVMVRARRCGRRWVQQWRVLGAHGPHDTDGGATRSSHAASARRGG